LSYRSADTFDAESATAFDRSFGNTIGDEDEAVAGVQPHPADVELPNGLVTHETQYFADPFDASRARAALAEPMPARDQ
jgi:hypothetical protein